MEDSTKKTTNPRSRRQAVTKATTSKGRKSARKFESDSEVSVLCPLYTFGRGLLALLVAPM